MRRREFIKKAGTAAGSSVMLSSAVNTLAAAAPGVRPTATIKDKPNILIIYTDQQNYDTLSILGSTVIDTPNLDRIGREGAVFENFYTNVAVCTPSRGCFLTGRYHHSHGAAVNGRPIRQDEVTFAKILQKNGYDTGYAGKWHLDGYDHRPGWIHPERAMGFEHCRYMFNDYHGKKMQDGRQDSKTRTPYDQTYDPVVYPLDIIGDEESYTTDYLTRKTIDFISRERDKPLCYVFAIPDPHHPWSVRPPYDTLFDAGDMPIPKTFNQVDLPRWAKTIQKNGEFRLDNPRREEQLRSKLVAYYGMVKLIDVCVGQILKSLEQKDILDNTIIVFTSDHGDYNGQHGLIEKNMVYEPVYHVPFLIRYPELVEANTVVDDFISAVDFQPTLLGMLGIEASGQEQGHDASGLFRDEHVVWSDEVFIYRHMDHCAGIVTPEYELAYVHSYHSYEEQGLVECKLKPPDSDGIFFDRRLDPLQENNLINNPGYADAVSELTKRLLEHNRAVGSPTMKWLKVLES
jgi:arylsulfatase A-like enzyme